MNGIKALKISVLVVIIVALIYAVISIFMHGNKQTFRQSASRDKRISTKGTDSSDLAIDGILINIKGNQYSYMKADITIKMKNTADKKRLEKNIQKVRSLILKYSFTKNGSILATPKGKEEYKNGLKDIISDAFGYEVQAIYFRDFVLAQ